jgi:KaiB domain
MILFTSPTSGPCHNVKPMVLKNVPGIRVVDVFEKPHLTEKYGISSVPALVDDLGKTFVGVPAIVGFLTRTGT